MSLAQADYARLREATDDDQFRPIPNARFLMPPPVRQWMVEGCFPRGTVAMLSGDGGIGKSLLMQQLLTCASLGLPWLDMHVERGAGLMLACEDDDDELHRRQWAIMKSLGRDIEDALDGGLYLAGRVGRDNTLARLDRKTWTMTSTDLLPRVLEFCLSHGISYLVVDTATQTFAGNQNDEQQVVGFINMLRRIATAIQGVVILTKHPSMAGRALGTGESGNTAWNNSVRSRLYIYNTKDGGTELKGMKSNYSRKLEKIRLRWERGVLVREQPAPPAYDAGSY